MKGASRGAIPRSIGPYSLLSTELPDQASGGLRVRKDGHDLLLRSNLFNKLSFLVYNSKSRTYSSVTCHGGCCAPKSFIKQLNERPIPSTKVRACSSVLHLFLGQESRTGGPSARARAISSPPGRLYTFSLTGAFYFNKPQRWLTARAFDSGRGIAL